MQTIGWIILGLALLFIAAQTYTTIQTHRTEQRAYTVIDSYGELELRRYPPNVLATVELPDTLYASGSRTGFRRLAGYIFGGNEAGAQIAMTAPVYMEKQEQGMRMAFVMPGGRTSVLGLPGPNDPGVRLIETDEEVFAVMRFGGWMNDARMAEMQGHLLVEVAAFGLEVTGPVTFMGYAPPWQLIRRRNEVAVPVRKPETRLGAPSGGLGSGF
ncbi:MAG: heme-binding protein [Flavobacteriales bacterium]|nr:heme-binding protein [Flavobacteriales bacterium]